MTFRVEADYDPLAWDRFVSTTARGHFMQSHAWGAFQRHLGWEPRFGVLEDGGSIRGAVLLLARKVPALGREVFYAPRGPAVALADASAVNEVFEGLAAYTRQRKAVFLRCDPYWTEAETATSRLPSTLVQVPRDWSYWNAPRFVFWLDLSGDEDAVMARMTSRARNDVRRGYKNNVVFSLGGEADEKDFYRLMVLTGNQKGIAFHGPPYYGRLLAAATESLKVQLFIGRLEGQAITAGISIAYGSTAWLMYAASDPAHYKLRANRTQQWEMIKWAHGLGCTRYDFRGTATNDPPSENDPGYGVYEFKKSFGPEFTRMAPYYDLVNRPLLYRMLRTAEEVALPAAYRVRTWLQK